VDSTLSDEGIGRGDAEKGRVPFHFTPAPSPCSDQSTKTSSRKTARLQRAEPGRTDALSSWHGPQIM
jgi:hypothetical protein